MSFYQCQEPGETTLARGVRVEFETKSRVAHVIQCAHRPPLDFSLRDNVSPHRFRLGKSVGMVVAFAGLTSTDIQGEGEPTTVLSLIIALTIQFRRT